MVELTAPLQVAGLGGLVAAHGIVGGFHTRPALIDASRSQEGLQYALTSLGVRTLLGVPAAELREHAVGLVDLFDPRAVELIDELHGAVSWRSAYGCSTQHCCKQETLLVVPRGRFSHRKALDQWLDVQPERTGQVEPLVIRPLAALQGAGPTAPFRQYRPVSQEVGLRPLVSRQRSSLTLGPVVE